MVVFPCQNTSIRHLFHFLFLQAYFILSGLSRAFSQIIHLVSGPEYSQCKSNSASVCAADMNKIMRVIFQGENNVPLLPFSLVFRCPKMRLIRLGPMALHDGITPLLPTWTISSRSFAPTLSFIPFHLIFSFSPNVRMLEPIICDSSPSLHLDRRMQPQKKIHIYIRSDVHMAVSNK